RISEAVGLDVDDLRISDGEGAVLLRGKGGKERIVPIGSFGIDAVHTYLHGGRADLLTSGGPAGALFLNARGGRLSRQSAWKILVRSTQRAGVHADVSPHTLRHSFA